MVKAATKDADVEQRLERLESMAKRVMGRLKAIEDRHMPQAIEVDVCEPRKDDKPKGEDPVG